MKHVLQKCLTLLTIILIFGLFSCEKDLYDENTSNKSNFKIRRITFEELQKIPNASNKIKSIKEKQNKVQNGRLIYDSINDFTIDTDKIVLAEKDGIIWLTFPIKRSYETDKTENLVLKSNADGTYLPFLFKYDLNQADKSAIYNGNAVDGIASKTSVKPLELHLDDIVSNNDERTTICVKVTFTYCSFDNPAHPEGETGAGANCPGHAIGEEYICGTFDNISDSGNGVDDGWTGNENTPIEPENSDGGGGGTATPNPTPIITVPLLELEDEVEENPCNRLKDLYDTNTLNTKVLIEEMKTKVNDTIEHGYSLLRKISASPSYPNVYTPEIAPRAGDNDMVEIEPGYFFYGGIHTHSINGTRMFSWGDLKLLKNLYLHARPENKEYVVLMMVVRNPLDPANPNVYAIRVTDFDKLEAQLTTDLAGIVGIVSEREKIENIHKNLGLFYKTNYSNIEKAFLERFSNYGISLYKANNTLDNWSNLYLQNNTITNTQSLTSIPCAQ